MDNEEWSLGCATATVNRDARKVTISLRGLVTAPGYEALHLRLARERALERVLVLGREALIVMTCRSAVEAAVRGTPARHSAGMTMIGVPRHRLEWALRHCLLMTREGLYRVAFVLEGAQARA